MSFIYYLESKINETFFGNCSHINNNYTMDNYTYNNETFDNSTYDINNDNNELNCIKKEKTVR